MRTIDIPVLIVGAGGSGLSASIFLADLGVDSLLIERHSATSHLPKAHYVNQRSMEIFRRHGVAEAIYAKAAPRENLGKIQWCTSIGGDGPLDGRVLIAMDVMGGGELAGVYDLKGVTPPTHIPQSLLEPVLQRIADQRNPGRVLFRHELIAFQQDGDGVDATVRDLDSNEDLRVRAGYLVAADAGKTVGPALGVTMVGLANLSDFVAVNFSADLSAYLHDDTAVMRMILHPEQDADAGMTAGALLSYGPDRWDRHASEWAVSWGYRPDDPNRPTMETAVADVQAFLKIEAPMQVHHLSHWKLESLIADRFSDGRIFLVGDAAHKHTPGGGLGLNSGVQDAHNLCWKLAMVLRGAAPESLLASYEPERRPVVSRNAEISVYTLDNHALMIGGMGIINGAPAAVNAAQISALLADTADGAARRERMRRVFELTCTEYNGHDMELGFHYSAGAVVDDGSPPPRRDVLGSIYTPTTRPGCRLPHVWLDRHGERVSTHDLGPLDGFLLLAAEQGHGWSAAAQAVAIEIGVPIKAVRIGGRDGDVTDPSGAWTEVREIDEHGAILVRPDGHVGYRAPSRVDDPNQALQAALKTILAR